MRLAMLAALAGLIGLAGPALALDKVKFGTNWMADPEAGGFYQAVADGTYAKYGLDVTIVPGGPQANGGLMLLFGKLDFFMGGDMIGNLLSAEAKLPLVAVAADFQKSPQISDVAPGCGVGQMGRSSQGQAGLCRRRRDPDFLRLAPARLRLQGREHPAVQFQLRPLHHEQELDPARLRHRRAVRDRKAGPFQAQRVPALRLRLRHLFDLDRDARRDRGEEPRSGAALRRCIRDRLVSLSLRRQFQSQRAHQARTIRTSTTTRSPSRSRR